MAARPASHLVPQSEHVAAFPASHLVPQKKHAVETVARQDARSVRLSCHLTPDAPALAQVARLQTPGCAPSSASSRGLSRVEVEAVEQTEALVPAAVARGHAAQHRRSPACARAAASLLSLWLSPMSGGAAVTSQTSCSRIGTASKQPMSTCAAPVPTHALSRACRSVRKAAIPRLDRVHLEATLPAASAPSN